MAQADDMANDRAAEQQRLAERLREAREYLGLSQEAVAAKSGISRPAISAIENSKRRVEALELQALAGLYRHPVEYFLADAGTVPDGVRAIAREAASLTDRDREEVLRFAQFLKGYTRPVSPAAGRSDGSAE